ncbi:hypothetical protein [Kineothrix sp. MB12-C1]|uniref:hypothetical protein n=1 Tax=Kineothrix sp. MB12-C1 TaxID=3070215 RepID=UPI0027D2BAA3|nr:hypothetical protein [Kineothrix sp. MB12-C1]WMC92375.1 hypothetical protein RBB56_16265 [Kineothrix sp. MB12-C1]
MNEKIKETLKEDKKVIIGAGVATLVVVVFLLILLQMTGGNLDVIGTGSITSFDTILQTASEHVTMDEENAGWSLEAPDGTVDFVWSSLEGEAPVYDMMLAFDARPFIDAGMDIGMLPDDYIVKDGKILIGTAFEKGTAGKNALTPRSSYEWIVENHRSVVNYHSSLDHYGVKLGHGNMFEWAKDMEKNTVNGEAQDKDIVFVLNPEPLIEAGVSPESIEGWLYAPVLMEGHGKTVEEYKLLKPFNIN